MIWCHVEFTLKWILRVSVNAYLYICPCNMLNVWMWSLFDGVNRFYCCLVSHIFIISQCHAYPFLHLLVLCIILYSTSFSSGELFCYILHVFIPIKLLLLLEGETKITAMYLDSRWITVTYPLLCFLMKYFFHWITETDVLTPPCKIFFYHVSEKGKEAAP